MSEKAFNLKKVIIIFFVIQLILSFFLYKKVHIGKDAETGKFSVSLVTEYEDLQETINKDIQPDRYIAEEKLPNPEQFTYNSKTIYNIFKKWFGNSAVLNFRLWRMLFFLDIFIILFAFYVRKRIKFIPSKIQLLMETFYLFLEDLVIETLGEKRKRFTAYFVTLFLFIWISNQVAILPIPGISEPTRNLNVPLGLGIMAVLVVHYNAIKKKGLVNYIKGYMEPLVFMLPLNAVGEVSKIISISFRLFGNIFGGAIITVVVSGLTKYIIVPVGLNLFFTMFQGTIQSFVFTMLALTYLSIEIAE
ncbi:MAG: F0F1 ATP synthase subunit A [Candidatus Cloacimonetes bacterium]|jgi:F-type H+-transporting ATPase subunit a|nr:F0F1 ATP synthase subunit A [Candidatus Cloacimonadota bacterium]MDD4155132.1 F0F1 ATP synthase subunit A [Candidatus Cloacimonadota bacterium]